MLGDSSNPLAEQTQRMVSGGFYGPGSGTWPLFHFASWNSGTWLHQTRGSLENVASFCSRDCRKGFSHHHSLYCIWPLSRVVWFGLVWFLVCLFVPHSSVLAWRIPGMEEPSRLPSVGSHRVGHDWSDLAAAAACCILNTYNIVNQLYLNQKIKNKGSWLF